MLLVKESVLNLKETTQKRNIGFPTLKLPPIM